MSIFPKIFGTNKIKIMSYCIIKVIDNKDGKKPFNCIIINSLAEVMEFDEKDEAEDFRTILETNSDSGHSYILKRIGRSNG